MSASEKKAGKSYEVDMLQGPLLPRLITVALPFAATSVLQILFSAVDLVVVGRFGPEGSLGAVGATTFIINLVINFFIGMSSGASVLAARYYATRQDRELSETVHTAIAIALIAGTLMILIGQFFSRRALLMTSTPADVIDMSVTYIRIYSTGMIFFMVYNYGAAILRAVGDSRHPLIYLAVSGTVNIGLNLLFVIVFDMGVAGVALGTVISQALSCLLIVRCLLRVSSAYRLRPSSLRIHPVHLRRILQVGLPTGIQAAIITFSNILLQSAVNSFGSAATSGYAAADNLFAFIYLTANSISQTSMNFVSQNYSVGNMKRVRQVILECLALSFVSCMALGSLIFFFSAQLLGIYTDGAEIISCGQEILRYTTLTYFLCGWMDLMPAVMRGLGQAAVPMAVSIVGTVGLRIFWIYLIFPQCRTLSFLFLCYPLSWVGTLLMQLAGFFIIWHRISGPSGTTAPSRRAAAGQ